MFAVDLAKIRELRRQKGIRQREMARFLGYKTQTGYSYLEAGKYPMRVEQLATIAQKLEVPIDSLFLPQ